MFLDRHKNRMISHKTKCNDLLLLLDQHIKRIREIMNVLHSTVDLFCVLSTIIHFFFLLQSVTILSEMFFQLSAVIIIMTYVQKFILCLIPTLHVLSVAYCLWK